MSIVKFAISIGIAVCITCTTWLSVSASVDRQLSPIDYQIQDFDFLDPNHGWLWLADHLYISTNGGQDWQDITPPMPADATLSAVDFFSPMQGYALFIQNAAPPTQTLLLAKTMDGGG
ncbi:MAG: hypothetical protein ACPL3P_01765, partial [Anaerolineales bacterium]